MKKKTESPLHVETPYDKDVPHQNECSNVKKEVGSLLHAETSYDNSRGFQSACEEGTIYTLFDINDWYEQSDDFIDDALRSNTDKFTSPDEILACEQKSDLFLHRHDGEPAKNTNDKEFSTICFICGKSFRCNSELKIHTRIHTGEKPFLCLFCPKAFRISSYLKFHTRIHTGEKSYQCSICGKLFRDNSGLKIHTRIHTGENPFPCSFCPKAFRKSDHLKSHSRIHTREKL